MDGRGSSWGERARSLTVVGLALCTLGCLVPAGLDAQQAPAQRGVPTGDVQSWYLQWPLPPGAERYRDIDGRRMHQYVVDQAMIARRFRDQGSPAHDRKFWGRVIGSSADTEGQEWLAGKFRAA